ncbi:hypothetical protein HDV00_001573 [Rhizophlyctis rosea]|nr:hypothetical protein HDV00_001573 [Rhizophlyctis rosea]
MPSQKRKKEDDETVAAALAGTPKREKRGAAVSAAKKIIDHHAPTRTPAKTQKSPAKSPTTPKSAKKPANKKTPTKAQQKATTSPKAGGRKRKQEESVEEEQAQGEAAESKAGDEGSSKSPASGNKRAKKVEASKKDESNGTKSDEKGAADEENGASKSPRRSATPAAEQAKDGGSSDKSPKKAGGAHLEVPDSGEAATQKPRRSPSPAKSPKADAKDGPSASNGKGRSPSPSKRAKNEESGPSNGKSASSPSKKDAPSSDATELEKGHIYFFYRPKVETTEVNSADDVARLHMILKPESKHPVRMIVLTRKKLPEINQRSRYWGFNRAVVKQPQELKQYLEAETSDTKTRGERHINAARPCGEGVYSIVDHHGHTHIAYVLELPEEPGEVQQAFNIEKEGSFIITVKNPETESPPWAGLSDKQKATFPKDVEELFKGRRFIPANPTTLLDYNHAEFVLIGASDDITGELGDAGQDLEDWEKDEHHQVVKLQEDKLFNELKLEHEKFKSEPLQERPPVNNGRPPVNHFIEEPEWFKTFSYNSDDSIAFDSFPHHPIFENVLLLFIEKANTKLPILFQFGVFYKPIWFDNTIARGFEGRE